MLMCRSWVGGGGRRQGLTEALLPRPPSGGLAICTQRGKGSEENAWAKLGVELLPHSVGQSPSPGPYLTRREPGNVISAT